MEQRAVIRNDAIGSADLMAPLFVPADRPDRVQKAGERGARAIIIDLEDAVAPGSKAAARGEIAQILSEHSYEGVYLVRVNSVDDPATFEEDLDALRPVMSAIAALILPKITAADQVRYVETQLADVDDPPALIPTIETARGVREAWDIAAAGPLVHTLLFGPVDLSADLGVAVTADGSEMLTARSTVVLACAAAGIDRPIDGPWPNLDDTTGLRISTQHARHLGFGGKIAIHPGQLATLADEFAPTTAELAWATEVVSVYRESVDAGVGAIRLSDGTFIDPPVAARASSILDAAQRSGRTA
ncbi:CoA ester lyase [Rhodococcus erythropolis]|uniref:HpcH/HpaI aldolase/citrate lyase family protein n=1 Tax=Rhodococcus erythropolis TaxID=1833 RepID=UPI00294A41E0|nr:CoA ester lyase [Rhodococcus erythropolis]MDV6212751.1 CoA ester lyase [Rhodococcus erythropolis]